jgi:peptidyl-prolyl cis-trans isomerase A (cyclophilin A)
MRSSRLVLNTGVGTIEIRLQETQAPQTTRFVRQLVAAGHFDGAAFYRSTTLGVDGRHRLIQGGPLAPLFTATADPIPDIEMLDTVESTDQTGLAHRCGTVSLARDLMTSGRVLPELFICLDDYPELDFGGRREPDGQGFPAFGVVTAGLDVVTAIAAQERSGASPVDLLIGEILTDPVPIVNATIGVSTTESSN